MDREELGEQSTKLLWGYPDLKRKLYSDVRPVLADAAREDRGRENEKGQRQDTKTECVGSDSFHPSVSLAALADGPGRLDEQPDSQSSLCTPTPDTRSRLAASEHTDPLKPASRNPNQWLDIYGVGERSKSQDDIDKRSRREQSEGELAV